MSPDRGSCPPNCPTLGDSMKNKASNSRVLNVILYYMLTVIHEIQLITKGKTVQKLLAC